MSLFGAMTTAISGLTAQSQALSNVSENVANSQTVGFKRTDTDFTSYLTLSNANNNMSGSVVARPEYTNAVQGSVTQVDNPLASAIAGSGYFAVSQAVGNNADGSVSFDGRQMYTRAGDFSMNTSGYLVNTSGYYLEGWPVTGGTVDRTQVSQIRIDESAYNPVATQSVNLSANLPSGVDTGTTVNGQTQVYDALGNSHVLQMSWTKNAADDWTLTVASNDDTATGAGNGVLGTYDVKFGPDATAGTTAPSGTINSITPTGTGYTPALGATSPTVSADGSVSGTASMTFNANFGQGAQPFTLSLGNFGSSTGVTQYAGTDYNVRSVSADGAPAGAFSSVSIHDNGDVAINYDNGQSKVVYRIPVVTFNDPDQLQRLDGQAFLRTTDSGEAKLNDVSANGAGKLVVGSVESSNVDMASEFSKLIVAQRAYTANTKIVTATDQMLQDTLNMSR